ncbi:carrier protein, putative [Ixodes scapularis]|uniref:Carrier protein, putative n=1 Tax=Ixodes scapularis TaxID=6945 RepID=B7QG87_IXOSC|nr:carrier protein, putative [Ixodes scapularis]|eukprot:XP_002401308.1 carrier protein, putative [Ixodes scapularis]
MGRKRKLPADYPKEYLDFEATPSNDLVVCKFCHVQVSTANGKGALDIKEHQSSNRHIQQSKPRLETGIPLHQTDGLLGSLFREKCPAARKMPSSTQMYQKYLPEVYKHDLETIKEAVKNRPISLTINETPELRGRPAVAVLVTFYDDEVRASPAIALGYQRSYQNSLDAFRTIFLAHGLRRGLWCAGGANVLRLSLGSAVQMSAYVQMKRVLSSGRPVEEWQRLTHNVCSSVAAAPVVAALDIIKIRLYLQPVDVRGRGM